MNTTSQGASPNIVMAVLLCIVVGAGAWYLMHGSSGEQEDKDRALIKKVHNLQTPLANPVKKASEAAAYKNVKTSAGLSMEATKTMVMEQIQAVYKRSLTPDEFYRTFSPDYKWEDYKLLFGADWLVKVYDATDAAANQKAKQIGLVEAKRAEAKRRAQLAARRQRAINRLVRAWEKETERQEQADNNRESGADSNHSVETTSNVFR